MRSTCPTGASSACVRHRAATAVCPAVPGQIDHFGVGIENFDAERVASELEAAGVEGVRLAGSTSVLVPDPDGVIVQLSSPTERFEGTPPNRDC